MTTTIVALTFALIATAAAETALPYPKGAGQCSGGYVQSGSYCVPKNERVAALTVSASAARCAI
jgi:hypothetical protein